jgi:hypothetical protein
MLLFLTFLSVGANIVDSINAPIRRTASDLTRDDRLRIEILYSDAHFSLS